MKAMLKAIKETIAHPIKVVQSTSDKSARLYYRYYLGTKVGDKYLCVVVKVSLNDAFVLTAYLTDKIKKGEILWPRK
jgi:myo-inositol-1-phosphate synthase